MSKPFPPLILLVEDEPAIRSVVADVIEDAGLQSEVAGNYADGVVLLHASRPALLIADVRLPDGDGHQLAAAGRQLGVPTLLISGHPEEIVAAEVSRSAFLAKPFRLAELRAAIGALIEQR